MSFLVLQEFSKKVLNSSASNSILPDMLLFRCIVVVYAGESEEHEGL
jgi:hypothetical protein